MSRIFITGDCHGEIDLFKLKSKDFPEGKDLTRDDYVIIAGDLGILWANKPDKQEEYLLRWLSCKPWTTLFIDGNHENFTRLFDLPSVEMFGAKVGKVNDSTFYLKRGEVYIINNLKFFCFGGADSIDKAYRKEGISWWPEEQPNWQETDYGLRKLNEHNFEVDYIIAHNGPRTVVDNMGLVRSSENHDPICRYFDHIVSMTKFTRFFFGHHHEEKSISKYQCLYKNIIEIT